MKIAVLGNLTVDEIRRNGKSRIAPGGSALYASAASAFFGARVSLFSNIGEDYPAGILERLKRRGVDVSEVKKVRGLSTRFRLTYQDASRKLHLLQPGTRMKPTGVRGKWHAAHIGPVYREVHNRLASRIRAQSDFLSLDLQGFIRTSSNGGLVQLVQKPPAILRMCDLVKASQEEAWIQTGCRNPLEAAGTLLAQGAKAAIVTLGRKGSILALANWRRWKIPAYPEDDVVDTTGSGDGFIGSWLPTFLSTKDPVWASSVASAFSSMMLRGHGLSKFRISRRELFRRSAWVYGKVETVEG